MLCGLLGVLIGLFHVMRRLGMMMNGGLVANRLMCLCGCLFGKCGSAGKACFQGESSGNGQSVDGLLAEHDFSP